MKRFFLVLLFPIFLFSKTQITTTYGFEEFFLKTIGKKEIRVSTISKFYENPIKLDKVQIAKFALKDAYFHFNLEDEKEYLKQLKKRNPELLIFDLSKDILKIKDNGVENPYVWLDPLLMRTVAKNIYEALVELDKFNKEFYKQNYMKFLEELDKIYLKTKKIVDTSSVYNIFVYDNYWDYFAKRFRINLYKREKKVLKTVEIKDLVKYKNLNEIKAVLVSSTDHYDRARTLAGSLNIKVKTHNPFEKLYFYNLKNLTKEFKD